MVLLLQDMTCIMHLSIFCQPGSGEHTQFFRQDAIPDRREFDPIGSRGFMGVFKMGIYS